MSAAEAEAALGKLRKSSANRSCVNCREQSRLGFGAVCVKFGTFVCNNCKSAHQSFSHRVKSVTMSTWTVEEVEALRALGGNDAARAKWFAKFSAADEERLTPKPGDNLDRYKELVAKVYEDKRWYDEAGQPQAAAGEEEGEAKARRAPRKPAQQQQQLQQQQESLFDLDDAGGAAASSPPTDLFGSLTIKGGGGKKAAGPADDIDLFGGGNSRNSGSNRNGSNGGGEVDLFGSDETDLFGSAPAPANPLAALMGQPPRGPSPMGMGMGMGTGMGVNKPMAMPGDDPFLALQKPPAPLGMPAPSQQRPSQQQMQQQQQQMMMMMQQQQMQQQMQAAAMSNDPFATLHVPKPRPMMPMPRGPQAGGVPPAAAAPGGMMPPMMMPGAQGMPRGAPQMPMQMQMPRGFPAMSMGMPPKSDDPFAGL
jgi:hypothetical protein